MKEIPFEKLLEQGLRRLGSPLSRRVYGDEIEILGILDAVSYEARTLERMMKRTRLPEGVPENVRALLSILAGTKTKEHQYVLGGDIPSFTRSAEYRGMSLEYVVYAEDDALTEEGVTRSIRKKAFTENVSLTGGRERQRVNADISMGHEEGIIEVRIEDSSEILDEQIRVAANKLHNSDYTKNSPRKIYEVVHAILTQE